MSFLIQKLGVSPELGFYDVYSIDDVEMLAFIPRPVYALIFICPAEVYGRARTAENAGMKDYDGSGDTEPVLWYRQTIGHSCGLMALIHSVCNGGAKQYIQPGSDLEKIVEESIPLKREARARVLYDSRALEVAHQAAAQKGDSEAPLAEDENYNHFISFVKAQDGHLWELNGGMKGPVDRGALEPEEDALSEKALRLGVRSFLDSAGKEGQENIGFSLVALAPSFLN